MFELRQYTLHGNRRDDLIALFERAFVEPQEALGAQILGTFRDLDDPDRFVWLRGFADMAARKSALDAFYGGPVWQTNRLAANATMIDSDNVLLLQPMESSRTRFPNLGQPPHPHGACSISLHDLGDVAVEVFDDFFKQAILPTLSLLGVTAACFASSSHPNNFPRLPVRENDRVYGWLAVWNTVDSMNADLRRLDAQSSWLDDAPQAVLPALRRKPNRLRLAPTSRSRM